MNQELMLYLIPVFAVLFVILLGSAILASSQPGGSRVKNRLSRVSGKGGMQVSAQGATSMRRSHQDSSISFLDFLIKKVLPNPEKLRHRLMKTGRDINIGQYFLACGVVTIMGFAVGMVVAGFDPAMSSVLAVGCGIGLPHIVIGIMGKKRQNRFLDLFPDTIDLICRGLKSGLPITESLGTVAREIPEPVGGEFQRIVDGIKIGSSLNDALLDVAKRMDLPEFNFLITAVAIQRETGGNLVETLNGLSDLLRKRRQMKKKIVALSSEGRASAWLLGLLPIALLFGLRAMNPDYMDVLFNDPRGNNILFVGSLFLVAAVLWIRKLVNFEI